MMAAMRRPSPEPAIASPTLRAVRAGDEITVQVLGGFARRRAPSDGVMVQMDDRDVVAAAEAAPAPAEAAPEIEPHLTPRKGHTPHHARPAPGTLAVRMPEGPSPLQPPPFEESPANDEGAAGNDGADVSSGASAPS